MISSDWWNIKWYTKSGTENLHLMMIGPLFNQPYITIFVIEMVTDKLSVFFRNAISNNFPVPTENLLNYCISKVSGEQESNHNSHTFCDIVSIITKYKRWIESTIMIITLDCKNL